MSSSERRAEAIIVKGGLIPITLIIEMQQQGIDTSRYENFIDGFNVEKIIPLNTI